MIIVKIIILHFIQITHTDDFPSTGTWLVDLISYVSEFDSIVRVLSNVLERSRK